MYRVTVIDILRRHRERLAVWLDISGSLQDQCFQLLCSLFHNGEESTSIDALVAEQGIQSSTLLRYIHFLESTGHIEQDHRHKAAAVGSIKLTPSSKSAIAHLLDELADDIAKA
jgi:response regulator of citrate/malate metabolism